MIYFARFSSAVFYPCTADIQPGRKGVRSMFHSIPLNISLLQIKLFLSIADTRSFSRTAELMHMEQSTLSRRIAILEQELGFSLFKRDSRPVQLTAEGQLLCEQWKALLEAYGHSLSLVYAHRARNQATLSVCVIDSGNQLSSIPSLGQLAQKELPGVTVSFQVAAVEQFVPRLLDGRADLAITSEALTHRLDPRFSVREILRVPLLACMLNTNPLSQKESITWDDLRSQRFISISDPAMTYQAELTETLCRRHGFVPDFGSTSQNAHGLSSALQYNNEVLLCDRFLRGIDSPLFKHCELPEESSALCAVSLQKNQNPYINPFMELLHTFYAE